MHLCALRDSRLWIVRGERDNAHFPLRRQSAALASRRACGMVQAVSLSPFQNHKELNHRPISQRRVFAAIAG
jgi:hypothetical protein